MKRKTNVFGIKFGTESELLAATGGTGRHQKLCVRVEDETAQDEAKLWPALRRRRRKELCGSCHLPVWSDPRSSILPAAETLICIPCLAARELGESPNG